MPAQFAEAARFNTIKVLGLSGEAAKFLQADTVTGQKLNALGNPNQPTFGDAIKPGMDMKQSLLGIVSSGMDLFGIVRVIDTKADDSGNTYKTIVTKLPKEQDGPDARATLVGEVVGGGAPLEIKGIGDPGSDVDATVRKTSFFVHGDQSGILNIINNSPNEPPVVITPNPPAGEVTRIESIGWSLKTVEARAILKPGEPGPVKDLGYAAIGPVELDPVSVVLPNAPLPNPNAPQPVKPFGTSESAGQAGWWDQSARVSSNEAPQSAQPATLEAVRAVDPQEIINKVDANEQLYGTLSAVTTELLQSGAVKDKASIERLVSNIRSGADQGGEEAVEKTLKAMGLTEDIGIDKRSRENPAEALENAIYMLKRAADFIQSNKSNMKVLGNLHGGAGVVGDRYYSAQQMLKAGFRAAMRGASSQQQAQIIARFQ